MFGHSCPEGVAAQCTCPVCLTLQRVSTNILSPRNSRDFAQHWLRQLRLFSSELQDSAEVHQAREGRRTTEAAAPPAASESKEKPRFKERREAGAPKEGVEEKGDSEEAASRRVSGEKPRKEKDKSSRRKEVSREKKDKKRDKREKSRHRRKEEARSRSRKRRQDSDTDTPVGRGSKPDQAEEVASEGKSPVLVPVKREPTSSASRKEGEKRKEKEKRKRAESLSPTKDQKTPPRVPTPPKVPENPEAILKAKSKPRPPSYSPPGHRRGSGSSGWRQPEPRPQGWRHHHHPDFRHKNRGVKKRERIEAVQKAGGLANWHATKGSG